jgi:hypothetical protein
MDIWYKKDDLHFPHLKNVMSGAGSEENFEPWQFMDHLEILQQEFKRHFQEFSSTEAVI